MLTLKPLGLQHQFLARRPLGQSQSLGVLPPLGVSRAVIAQTFPVLQLSLEQSARSPQTDRFWDGLIASPSESGFTSERSRPDQPSTASPPTSPVSILQSPTVERTVAKSTFPENLSLLSRKPLTAPEPLGGLLPLEQLSEQSSSSIDPQQESSPNLLEASFHNASPSESEPLIADVPTPDVNLIIQPSTGVGSAPSAVTPEATATTDSSIPDADSIPSSALPEIAQTIPVARQPNVSSSQVLLPTAETSATSVSDSLSESDGLSERVSETQPSLNQIVETQASDPLQPYVVAETLEAGSSEAETTIDAPKSTAIDAQPQLGNASIAEPSIANLQRSVDVSPFVLTPSILEADPVPSFSSDTQRSGNAEESTDLVQASQTLQPEATETEPALQVEPTASAASDETIAIQPQTEQTATPIDPNRLPAETLQRRLESEDPVDSEHTLRADQPTQDDRSDTTVSSINAADNSTLEPSPVGSTLQLPALEERHTVAESPVQPTLDRESSETGSVATMEAFLAEPTNEASTVMPIATDRSETLVDRPTEGTIQAAAVPNQVSSPIEPSSIDAQDPLQRRGNPAVEQHSPAEISISESSREQASATQPNSVHPPGLLNAVPLVSPKSLLTPSLPLTAPLMESTLDDTTVSGSTTTPSTDQTVFSPDSSTIARKPTSSNETTVPVRSPSAGATPDSWSSLADLLNQSASNQPEARSWQDVVADLSDAPQTPSVQRLESEEVGIAEAIADSPSESITLSNTDASEQISTKAIPEVPATAQGQTGALDDEKLDQLALAVYSHLRMQLEIDRERHGLFTTGHQLWLSNVPSVTNASNQTKTTQKNQQKPEANDMLSPLDAKLERLTGEVHYLLRSQIEIAQERYGYQNRLHI